jgi:hypothetical protein
MKKQSTNLSNNMHKSPKEWKHSVISLQMMRFYLCTFQEQAIVNSVIVNTSKQWVGID